MGAQSKWEGHARLLGAKQQEESGKVEHTKFTEEHQQRRRDRANKPHIPREVFFNSQATKDTIRHFAEGIGDKNPLFCNEAYAKKSKYGGVIAHGTFLYTVDWAIQGFGGPGVHGWYVGGDWEWYRPVKCGDEFTPVCVLRDLVEKKGKMGGGKTWIDYGDVIYVNQNGEVVGKELCHTGLAEREAAGAAAKNRGIPRPTYSSADWINILDAYENEEVRGSNPRYWEDVQEGEQLKPMIKGPLSVRDEIAWLMGCGSPFMKAHKLEYDYERRHPKTLEYVESGEADLPGDVPELVHFLNVFAQAIGIERAYDYGNQRMSWLCNYFTNWMGDDGFLWKMSGDLRAFNLIGDITTFEGKVVKKYIDDGKCCVDIEAWANNNRGQVSMPPHISTVILPSKQHGPVKYPDVPKEIYNDVKIAKPIDEMVAKGLI
ncbi:MAG: MaoC family dehydratase N-terminal domain-containing protein [Desulfobulbaceae bacterium]|nr:MaoC family dehydratase N-terminal domain-containing protein [Desulfobulbaceae bacterium]